MTPSEWDPNRPPCCAEAAGKECDFHAVQRLEQQMASQAAELDWLRARVSELEPDAVMNRLRTADFPVCNCHGELTCPDTLVACPDCHHTSQHGQFHYARCPRFPTDPRNQPHPDPRVERIKAHAEELKVLRAFKAAHQDTANQLMRWQKITKCDSPEFAKDAMELMSTALGALTDMVNDERADRDAWRTQHENILACWRNDLTNLTKAWRGATGCDTPEDFVRLHPNHT